jgi:uncharacterized protein YndB with AHSA1/START domain
MGQITESIDIRAPIDRVFAALTDPSRGADWNPAITEISGITPGPTALGTTWHQSTVMGGRTVNLVCRVTRLDAPHLGVLEVTGDQRGQITTRCVETADGTRVTQTLDFVPPRGVLGGLAGGFISSALRREMVRSMERQRTVIEEESRLERESRTS